MLEAGCVDSHFDRLVAACLTSRLNSAQREELKALVAKRVEAGGVATDF